ncbi:MAG: NifU family protein [Saprospiraceae bacterium]|nr:NifU family protein [Saprospiraceae bacterium]
MVAEIKSDFLDRINAALDDVRPFLKVDGGNVEVVDVTEDNIVHVRWLGNCETCSMSSMTMKAGIEQAIRTKMPEIKGVIAINGVQGMGNK